MAFPSGVQNEIGVVGSGEIIGNVGVVSSYANFEDGLKAGLFAKYNKDTEAVELIDGEANPVVAGVVRRAIGNAIEDGGTFTADNATLVDVVESGIVTVDVVAGVTPSKFDKVYVYNGATVENQGKATNDATDSVEIDGYFYKQISDTVWAVRIK